MSVNSVNTQNKTGFSANPVEIVEQVINEKKAIKNAVNETLDSAVAKVAEAAAAPVEKALINSVAPVRRLACLPDMFQKGDTIAAVGLGGLTIISLPEDCRDLKDALKTSKTFFTGGRLSQPYNYKKFQHDFSFFRGTLLHEWMKTAKSDKMKNFVSKVYSMDKTLYNTGFGKMMQKLMGIQNGRKVLSKVKNLDGSSQYVQQIVIKKDFHGFKDMTARAMKRTSVLGVAFLALLELPKIIKTLRKGDDTNEKIKEGSKQLGRGALNVLGVSAGMGYGGAWGAKKFGAVGSLIGMGIGLLAGCGVTDLLKRLILPKTKTEIKE